MAARGLFIKPSGVIGRHPSKAESTGTADISRLFRSPEPLRGLALLRTLFAPGGAT